MDFGSGIVIASGVFTGGLTVALAIHAAIVGWHDRRVKEIRAKLIRSLNRERRLKLHEKQCKDALYALYEWVNWAQRSLPAKYGSSPAPMLPERPRFDINENDESGDVEDDENTDERNG